MKPFFCNALISLGILILLLGGAFLWMIWWVLTPHTDESIKPVLRETAIKHIKSDFFPKNAHNIQYSFSAYQVSPNFESFLRYEAPADDCIALAKSRFPNIAFNPIAKKEQKIQSTMGKNVGWFDNDHITRGLAGGKGYEGEPRIWIDNDRGIFYYFLTD